MTNDRNYLRMMSNNDLIVMVGERFMTDLELVLLERLSALLDVEERLEDITKERDEMEAKWTRWMDEAISLHAQLDAINAK